MTRILMFILLHSENDTRVISNINNFSQTNPRPVQKLAESFHQRCPVVLLPQSKVPLDRQLPRKPKPNFDLREVKSSSSNRVEKKIE